MAGEVKTLLVELDCLLDTRLATVSHLDQEAATALLTDPAYRERDRDDFGELTQGRITHDQFIEAYAARDKDVLKQARPTRIIKLVHEIALEIEQQRMTTPGIDSLVIDINVYPYELSDTEREYICSAIRYYVGMEPTIQTVSITPEDLTPTAIRDNWDGVILYDFDQWFTHHANALNTVLIPRHLMFVPALFIKRVENPEDLVVEGAENMTPFTMLEMSMVERLSLEMLRPKEFSIIDLTA